MIKTQRPLALALALGIGLATLHASPALAQPPASQPTKAAREEAAVRFKKGIELFKDGDFQAALIEFRRANELAPNYNVLYNIGQVSFQLQDYPGALNALQRYLAEGGNQITAGRRADVERDIEKLKARVANLEVTSTVTDADVSVDDVPIGKTPLGKPLMVSAGRHKISISKAGFTANSKFVEIASGDSIKVALDPGNEQQPPVVTQSPPSSAAPPPAATVTPPVGPAPPVEPPPEKSSVPWAGWVITGGLAVGAGVFGGLALGASGDLKTQRTGAGATRDGLNSARDKTAALALVSDICTGGAIVAAGISLYLTVSGGSSDAKSRPGAPPSTSIRLQPLPTGAQLLGTF